jgi:hypothetical protein
MQNKYQSFFRIFNSGFLFLASAVIISALSGTVEVQASDLHVKPRVIATTDGEVDDRSSMIRFLLYSSDFDVFGIVQVNSKYQKSGHSGEKWIEEQIDEYEALLPNLRIHNPDYPDADYLRSVLRVGNENSNDLYVAPPEMSTKNTSGEQLIIQALLDDDPRPVHVLSWGGANTTASALWRLKYSGEYTTEQFNYAASRIRIYCIWYQDGGGQWIEDNVKEAYINEAYRWDDVWDYHSIGTTNPSEQRAYMKEEWLNENVKTGHGSLGAMYPQSYTSEGDTPSFLHLINNGLEAQNDYTLGGWGGRSAYDNPEDKPNHVTDDFIEDDGNSNKMYWRWIIPAQNDFAARMDWCVAQSYSEANHQPAAEIAGSNVRTVSPGQIINLDASATTDPDGDRLTYFWWQYHDADNAISKVDIDNPDSISSASFVVPDEPGKQVHIILEATDDGSPPLKSYQRIVFNISEGLAYNLTTSVIGQGDVSPSGGDFTEGSSVVITAIAEPGWRFDSWTGDANGSDNPLSLIMDGNKSVTATFNQVPTHTLTSSVTGKGRISPSNTTFPQGEIVSITAIPDTGWAFDSWSGDLKGRSNPANLTMDTNKTIIANFIESTDPLEGYSYCSDEGQTCTFEGTVDIAYGADDQYYFLYDQSNGSISCDNDTFSDPIYGTKKACYIKPVSTDQDPPLPPEPTPTPDPTLKHVELQATAGDDTIKLTWSLTGITPRNQQVYRDTDPDPRGRIRIGVTTSDMTFVDADVTPGTTYYYWIKVVENDGTITNSSGVPATVPKDTPTPTPSPTPEPSNKRVDLQANAENGTVRINWSLVGITPRNQQVYRDTDPDPSGRGRIGFTMTDMEFIDADVTPGTTYYYWIKVVENDGTVTNSSAVPVTIPNAM